MESLIGWNFDLRKQTSLGIFGKVLGWCDTTEEQARFSLHSQVLPFIAEFDALVSMLWSDCDTIREAAQKELTMYMMKTMSSTYELKEEDFIHEKPLKSATISNHQDTVQDGQTLENTHNSITVLRQEDIIQDDEHVELSYGMMRYRGNVSKNKGLKGKKDPTTLQGVSESDTSEAEMDKSHPYTSFEASDRTLRVHVKGKCGDNVQEQFSAKKMKLSGDFKGETFFMDDVKQETPSATQPSSFEVEELSSDSEEDEVHEIRADSDKKISASQNKGTSASSQKFHGSTPQRLTSPMKSSEKKDNLKLSEKQKPRQPIKGSEVPPNWISPLLGGLMDDLKDFVKDEIDKAKLKPEQNKKDEAEKTHKENSEEVEENQEQGN
jgi:hypothetical protein